MSPVRRLVPAAALVATALAVAGCGDEDDTDAGPAAVVPASAPVYIDVSLRPEGEAKEAAEAALGKILDTEDPGARVVELVEQEAAKEGEDFDYADEIEPWLGERFAIFLTKIGGETSESKGAFVFETTDVDRALDFFRSDPDSTGKTGEYEGVEYEIDADKDVLGAVDDFIVGGDLAGFKAAVDASDGETLADSDRFEQALEEIPEDSLATVYVPPEQFLDAVKDPDFDPQSRNLVKQALGDAGDEPVLGDVTASAEAITIELSAGGGGVETEESGLLSTLPADAWLALGLPDIGAAVQNGVEQVEKTNVPGLDGAAIREQLRNETGIELDQEVVNALGDAAVFVSGTSQSSLGGALVIESKDPEASAGLLTKLQDVISSEAGGELEVEPLASTSGDQGFQLTTPRSTGITDPDSAPESPGLAQTITVIQRDDRIVAGYGGAAVNQVLAGKGSGAAPLQSKRGFRDASDAVGELGMDLFLDFGPVLDLAESAGAAADPQFERARPYFDSLDFLAVGTGTEGERSFLRMVVGLR